MLSASSYPKTQKTYQLWQDELCIVISKNPEKVPSPTGLVLHPRIQKPTLSINFVKQDELYILISKNPDKVPTLAGCSLHLHIPNPLQSTNLVRMSSASSYPKPQTKNQLRHDDLCILISKNPDKVPSLAR